MLEQCSIFPSLKESPFHTKISRYLFYFIWMLVDILCFVLGTVCMVLMVRNSEIITDWFVDHTRATGLFV
ncbi:unnamed protein product [Trichobilharzia szidati]|nr:unnamed protein product [Trichobilharzia szidati]